MAEAYSVRRIKGDIAEAICKNHLSAMGLDVEFAGVEHFARAFANRQREGQTEESNEGKIHNYIGRLPDILAGDRNYGYYFVEVKYRTGVNADAFARELLWDYRKVIFKNFDTDIFKNITRAEWDGSTSQSTDDLLRRFDENINNIAISFENKIAVPILFYILIKSEATVNKFTLHLSYFDKSQGKFYLHQAGDEPRKIEELALSNFISSFNECFFSTVVPVLNDLFNANIQGPASAKHDTTAQVYENNSLVYLCYCAARKLKKEGRRGVYFSQLLTDEAIANRLKEKSVQVDRFGLKSELEREGLSTSINAVSIDGKNVFLSIKEYLQDYDFYGSFTAESKSQ